MNGTTSGGSGKVSFNHATVANITKMYINELDDSGDSIESFLQTISSVTSTIKGFVRISKKFDSTTFIVFEITGANETGSEWAIDVDSLSSSGSFATNDDVIVSFVTNGDKG